ncbi:hypothetical protein ACKKBG_A32590 [Auxenochlorella protothecoides x Auxenochlorella symbiontica]
MRVQLSNGACATVLIFALALFTTAESRSLTSASGVASGSASGIGASAASTVQAISSLERSSVKGVGSGQASSDGVLPASSSGGFAGSSSDSGRSASTLAQVSATTSRPGAAEARATGSAASDSTKATAEAGCVRRTPGALDANELAGAGVIVGVQCLEAASPSTTPDTSPTPPGPSPSPNASPSPSPGPSPSPAELPAPYGTWEAIKDGANSRIMLSVESEFAATSVTCSVRNDRDYVMDTFTRSIDPATRTATFNVPIDYRTLVDIRSVVCIASDQNNNISPEGLFNNSTPT